MHVQLIDKVGLRSIGLVSDRGRLKIIYTKCAEQFTLS